MSIQVNPPEGEAVEEAVVVPEVAEVVSTDEVVTPEVTEEEDPV